ncbi:MAG: dienelactone hydrolase family protein [Gemmatimonadaceae bacterium]|nr:dienelactone hydrolase family protein [Gemmatimonadaceae bacterium]
MFTRVASSLRLILLALALPGYAAAAQRTTSGAAEAAYRQEGSLAGFPYLAFVTGGARPTDRLPMIVGLHYSGATLDEMAAYFADLGFRARVVLPQGSYPRPGAGRSWFPSGFTALPLAEQEELTNAVVEEVSGFIAAATATFPTRGKPVVAGVSYGGDLSFLIALRHPERLAAAFPVAARFRPDWMPRENHCTPQCPLIMAMHGEADTTVPPEPTRRAAQQLARMGFRVEFRPYAGVAHDFAPQMRRDFATAVRQLVSLDRP